MDERAAPPTELLAPWLAISADLLVATDRRGRIVWANAAFHEASGLQGGDALPPLLHADGDDDGDDTGVQAVARALAGTALVDEPLRWQPAGGGGPRWLSVRTAVAGAGADGAILWTLRDVTDQRAGARREHRLAERLEIAQEFGRLGVWERRIPSGEPSWDWRMLSFWGLDPDQPAPGIDEELLHVHPDDRASIGYLASTRQPGRYEQRFRVVQAGGAVRRLHSQWQVIASPRGEPQRAVGVMVDDTEAHQLAQSRDAATALLRLTVDLANIVNWRHDFATDLLHYNRHGFEVLGMTPRHDGVALAEVRELTHPDDLPQVVASAARALESGLPDDAAARYRHVDGSWRTLLMRRLLQRGADGTPIGFIGVSLDITEQINRSREAAELAHRLESVADAAGIGISSRDPATGEGTWNRQMYRITGRSPALGVPTLDEWLHAFVHPADRGRMRDLPAAFGQAPGETVQLDYRIVRPDTRTRWLESRCRLDERDGRRLIVGITFDITDRRAAEDALLSADRRAALAARSAGIGTWEVDFDAALQVEAERWDAQMFHLRGLAPADQPPARAERLALVHPDDRHLTVDASGEQIASDRPLSYEFRLLMADGSVRWLASRSIVMGDADQPVRRRIGINWDVTESRQAETARQEKALAERENRAKSQFLSRMSHELRTPLNAVLGFTELLHLEASRTGAAGTMVQLAHIRAAGEHLLALINDVLELSALESGALRLEARPVALAELVAETLPLLEPLARSHGVSLLPGAPPALRVLGDRRRLRQVLINLLSNAIKYNRPGGRVWLEADEVAAPPGPPPAAGSGSGNVPRSVRLRVGDSGRGLSAQQLGHLFEPFNRLGVERESIEGSGIGLVIVKALVEGMGGAVAVRSEPAAGTVFEVVLPGVAGAPAAADEGMPPSAKPPPANEAPPPLVGRLLYIEDNPVNLLVLEELVARHTGLVMASAVTGAAGVARARELQPDLVLVDMQLPDFDGHEVLARLRADPATAGLRCIALSANAMAQDIERALAAGFIAYWTKPVDFGAFLAALRTLLAPQPPTPGGAGS